MTESQGDTLIGLYNQVIQQNSDIIILLQVIIFAFGLASALMLIQLFMKAWVRNT